MMEEQSKLAEGLFLIKSLNARTLLMSNGPLRSQRSFPLDTAPLCRIVRGASLAEEALGQNYSI